MFLFDPALHKVLVCFTTWPVDFSLVEHINSISEFNTSSVLANTLSGFQGEFLILGNGSFMLTLSWDMSQICGMTWETHGPECYLYYFASAIAEWFQVAQWI